MRKRILLGSLVVGAVGGFIWGLIEEANRPIPNRPL